MRKMREVSATVTVGQGSEKHNHDIEYRQTLEHVHGGAGDVIELVPYTDSYEKQINDLMKPYIEKFNQEQERKYQAAWDRYNAGKIKNRPKQKDYKKMSFDYFKDHKDDTMKNPQTGKIERLPIYRSMILGIGDQEDKKNISREEAVRIFGKVIENFKKDFPDFKILGATIHADEAGFWHAHLDYKPLYERLEDRKGLAVGTGLEGALKRMGYEPEQSIINGRDKVPLLFNAMRNQIYREMETAMAAEKIRLQYGVSKIKDPGKNPSVNKRMEIYQAEQDAIRELQHNKNVAVDILENDTSTPGDVKEALKAVQDMAEIVDKINKTPEYRFDKKKGLVEFHLLDQLKSIFERFKEFIWHVFNSREEYRRGYESVKYKLDHDTVDRFEHESQQIVHRQELAEERQRTENLKNYLKEQGLPEEKIADIAGERSEPRRDVFGDKER